jgi:hypothetical protein
MAEVQCKKCGCRNVKLNGKTNSGRQQYHCRDCGVYTTTLEGARDWAALYAQIDQLHWRPFCRLTLRNWCANLNRKTLAISQSVALHCTRIRLVINHYNSLHAGLW